MRFIYSLFIRLYGLGIRLAAARSPKARKWVEGRRGQWKALEDWRASAPGQLVWIHAASAGEFEQGKPVVEALKARYPGLRILVSFFSPSGFEGARRYPAADHYCYLPLDTAANAHRFVDTLKPSLVLFIKYEYWHHHLSAVQRAGIPLLLISAIFREGGPFFRPWGGFWRSILRRFTHLFVQDADSKNRLESIGIAAVTVSGDTRFDRVAAIARSGGPVPGMDDFAGGLPVLVAGSTWPEDESALGRFFKKESGAKLLLAPHEVNRDHLQAMQSLLPPFLPYSQMQPAYSGAAAGEAGSNTFSAQAARAQVLVVDSIGLLSRLYRYGQVAYVGGGFNRSGIHNILEAAVYGIPVVFGPYHQKFREASGLLQCGGAFTFRRPEELQELLHRLLFDEEARQTAGRAAARYVHEHQGATDRILRYIEENRLLTSA